MFKKEVELFEFPTSLGLRKKRYETSPGVQALPDWLRTLGFYQGMDICDTFHLPAHEYLMDFNEATGLLNADHVIQYAKEQAFILHKQLQNDYFKLIIGGDCSVLIGTSLALKQKGTYALFFLDGHTDYIPSERSQTGGIAGMDLAVVSGYGEEKLTNISGLKPYFEEDYIYCVGNRELTPSYIAPILNTNINYYDLNETRSTGATSITQSFLQMVEDDALDGFFIHLDVDVLSDEIMPAVDSRAEGGLTYQELTGLIRPLIHHPRCTGVEITILDPSLDTTGEITRRFIETFYDL